MRFVIKGQEPEDQPVELWLIVDRQGDVELRAQRGDEWAPVLWCRRDGKMQLNSLQPNVLKNFGFVLENDRVGVC